MKQHDVHYNTQHADLLEGDPYLINRIVGYYEYGLALKRLTRFVEIADEEELSAAEAIVQDEDQFQVYGLYGDADEIEDRPKSRDKSDDSEDVLDDKKQEYDYALDRYFGLARLMALARVETAAILAGFSKHRAPFEAVRPTEYEFEAYKEFVFEGARSQFEMIRDSNLRRTEFPPTRRTLAVMRGLNIARHFTVAAAVLANHESEMDFEVDADAVAERDVEKDVDAKADPEVASEESDRRLIAEYPLNTEVRTDVGEWLSMKATLDQAYEPFETAVWTYVNTAHRNKVGESTRLNEEFLQRCRDGVCSTFVDVDESAKTTVTSAHSFPK